MSSSESPLLLHIGYPKAASTWLQKHFFQPGLGFGQVLNPLLLHRDLVQPGEAELAAGEMAGQITAAIDERRSSQLQPVVSSESLCGDLVRGGANAELIASRLSRVLLGEVRVLLVVREQADFLRSAYKTLVLFGAERSLAEMLSGSPEDAAGHFHLGFLHYDQVVERYQALFGPASVCVLPYELFQREPSLFLNAIMTHGGRGPLEDEQLAALPLAEVANPGQSLAYLHLQRWRNRLAHTADENYAGRGGSNAYDTVMQRIARHKRAASSTPLDAWLEKRFRRRVEAGVRGVFEASNRRLQDHCSISLAELGYRL